MASRGIRVRRQRRVNAVAMPQRYDRAMPMSRRAFLALAGAAAAQAPLRAAGQPSDALAPGRHPLTLGRDRDGLILVPSGYTATRPAPLIVLLHGAGGSGASIAGRFPFLEDSGAVVLAPDSRDERTWDVILGGFGPDVEFIGTALAHARRVCSVDAGRIVLAGFSDGASYALSLGIGTGDVFGRLMAFSPGVLQPERVRGKPRIFISHGTADSVIPIDVSSRAFVPRLQHLGYDVTYREFAGGHTVPESLAREAFAWALR